jgi:hypothetical protein
MSGKLPPEHSVAERAVENTKNAWMEPVYRRLSGGPGAPQNATTLDASLAP